MDLTGIISAQKAASYGSAQGVYYLVRGGEYVVIDPQKEVVKKLDVRAFRRRYAPYSMSLPETICARLDAMPSFYDWKAQCGKK